MKYLPVLCVALLVIHCTPKEEAPMNILLIVADDLGYTDLGCFGSEIRTPNLDALATEGIRFTDFHTAATCSPTRAMLLTGVTTHKNGYGTMEGDLAENQVGLRGYETHLNWDVVTFPSLLRDQGYHTSIAGKWHQAFPPDDASLWADKRGFDRSFCMNQGGAGHFDDKQKLFGFQDRAIYVEDGKEIDQLPTGFYSSEYYASKVISYINESQELGKPFFSFLSFTAPHWPLQVPDQYAVLYQGVYDEGYEVLAATRLERAKTKGVVPKNTKLPAFPHLVAAWDALSVEEKKERSKTMEIYAAMIERLDHHVGRVIDHLKKEGLYENTLIVFMADNGAEGNDVFTIKGTEEWVAENWDNSFDNMGRKGSYIQQGRDWALVSSMPYKYYKAFASEGGVRTPMIVRHPRQSTKTGKIEHQYLSVMDLAPTFLEAAGAAFPIDNTYQGREVFPIEGASMGSFLTNKTALVHPAEKAHVWELYGRIGVRKGQWKGLKLEPPFGTGDWELYDLSTDIGEQNDVAASNPELVAEMEKHWQAYAKENNVVLPENFIPYGYLPDK
ncbi:MAG: arylsulfatase [Cytophagales bacterium]|nr:arylsulfatase [Cytophagales bacterium]